MDQTGTVASVRINGPALRAIRERSGMSCSALARAVGADVSFLARVERGEKRGVGRSTYEGIVEVLAIDGRAILLDPFAQDATHAIPPLRGHRGPTVVPSSCKAA